MKEEYSLGSYLDPITRIWSNIQPESPRRQVKGETERPVFEKNKKQVTKKAGSLLINSR